MAVRAEPNTVTFGTSRYGANTEKASRISARAAAAIFRSSVSGRSPISPIADSSISRASRPSVAVSTDSSAAATIAEIESGRPVLMPDRSYEAEGPGAGRSVWSRRVAGPMIGVVATGAGLAVGELLVGAIEGAVSPVVAVGNKVIDLVPLPLKNWAVETFGTSDKVVLVVTTLAILFIAGIVIGTLAVTGRRTSALIGTAVVGLVGVAAVLTRPDPTVAEVVPIVVGTLVSGGVLWWLAPPTTVAVDVAAPPSHAVATVGVTDEFSRSNRRPPSSRDRVSPIVASSCCAASVWRRSLSSQAASGGCCNVATTSGRSVPPSPCRRSPNNARPPCFRRTPISTSRDCRRS